MEKYSRKKGNEHIVIESQFINKLFVIEISLLVLSIISVYFLPTFGIRPIATLSHIIGYSYINPVLSLSNIIIVSFASPVPIIGVFLRIVMLQIKNDFRFYFAKGCCEIISKRGVLFKVWITYFYC